MNQRKAGAILSYVGFFFSNIVALIYTPYMLRMMGQSEYGLYGTASSLTSYLSLLSFGIGGAYLRFSCRYRANHDLEGERRLNGAFLLIFTILAGLVVIFGAGLVVFSERLVEQTFTSREMQRLQMVMVLSIVSMVLCFLFNVIMMALLAYEKYLFIRVVNLVAGIVTPIANVIVLSSGGRAVALSVISVAVSIGCYISYVIYALKVLKFKMSFKGIKLDFLKEIFIFSSFLFLNSITDQITNATDSVILGAVSGTVATAIYTVGASFRTYFLNFSTAISSVFAPQINSIVVSGGTDSDLDEIFIRVGRIQFYILSLVLIGYIFIGYDFIQLWAGKDYSDAYTIGLLLILAVFVPLFQNVGLEIQKAKNKHKARSIVYLLIALVNVGMTIPMAKWWDGIGAALATMICMFAGNAIFMNWYYAKHIHLNIWGFWKSILSIVRGFIAPVVVGAVIDRYWNLDSYQDILLAVVIMVVVYMTSIWVISMNRYEKDLILKPVRKLFRRGKRS